MAYWNNLKSYYKQVTNTLGDGENVGSPAFQIGDAEYTASRNMDSREYPAATVRPGRTTFATILSSDIQGIGQRNNSKLHAHDGKLWKVWESTSTAWTTLTSDLTATPGEFGEFATGTQRFTVFMNSTQKLIWDGSSDAPTTISDTNCPYSRIFTVHKGRIYVARENDIVYCALNKTSDWTTADDSGSIDITRAKGVITGLFEYNDKVIAWTKFSMHELYGTGPSNYELVDIEGDVGCISDKSIIRCNRKLYWLWYDGVYEYTGASPEKVSGKVDDYIKDINLTYVDGVVAGAIGDYLYLAIPYGSTATANNLVLKYDTRNQKWYPETGAFKDFVTIGNVLYGVDYTGQTWDMRNLSSASDAGTAIDWYFITKPYNDKAIGESKTITDMHMVVDMSTDSTSLTIGYSTLATNNDSTTFTTLKSFTDSSNIQNEKIYLPLSALQNVNWYRLKVAGSGQATIHYLQKNLRVKPR